MNSRELTNVIEQSAGRILSVTFRKNDGTLRRITCRLGVKYNLKGGPSFVDYSKYILVFDLTKKGYRSINRDSIIEVRYEKKVWNSSTPSIAPGDNKLNETFGG